MSNALAIAAVTATLRRLIIQGVPELPNQNVTAKPPDRAFNGNGAENQINLFLYQMLPSAAWRNQDMPRQVRSGETGQQPLALTLHYLLSATGAGDDELLSHQWLGEAMQVLHDHAVLGRTDILAAIEGSQLDSDLHEQVERVRITPLPLSLDDLSKLWTTFTTPYRVSAAYEVSVVLIESKRPTKTPLPILARGKDNQGLGIQPNLFSPFPLLSAIETPNPQGGARFGNGVTVGDRLTLQGYSLGGETGDTVTIRFRHPRLTDPLFLPPTAPITSTQVNLQLPNTPPAQWLAGLYGVAVTVQHANGESRTSNELPLAIAPRLLTKTFDPASRTLTITCSPEVLPEQQVALLIGDRELRTDHSTPTDTLEFDIPNLPAGDYFLRLRVDGVDSLLVIQSGTPPTLQFDPDQQVSLP